MISRWLGEMVEKGSGEPGEPGEPGDTGSEPRHVINKYK